MVRKGIVIKMRICAVGDYDSICGFAALGMDIFETTERDEIKKLIENSEARDYAVILITENAAKEAMDVIDKYKSQGLPAIIPIPSVTGSYDIGMSELKKAVEKAVGSSEMVFG